MGSPPPQDFPPPSETSSSSSTPQTAQNLLTLGVSAGGGAVGAAAGGGVSGAFGTPNLVVSVPCVGGLVMLPSFGLAISVSLLLELVFFKPAVNWTLTLTCSGIEAGVNVSSGLAWGAGRVSNAPPDPDLSENDPTF